MDLLLPLPLNRINEVIPHLGAEPSVSGKGDKLGAALPALVSFPILNMARESVDICLWLVGESCLVSIESSYRSTDRSNGVESLSKILDMNFG